MTNLAVRVENISKKYRIGAKEAKSETFVEAIMKLVKAPMTNFRKLQNLSNFRQEDEDDVIWALKDVTFDVKMGESVAIVGNNGAGKSTLLKILSKITDPTTGSVIIKGKISSLLEVGTGFHPDLTGRENVYLNGTILGMKKTEIDRKFDEIVDFSGVAKFVDTQVKRYSSGMRVRLAFAVAAFLEPDILIIDEVLAVGDLDFQRKCLGKMDDVAKSGRTVLFVSHNMAAVRNLCQRGIMLVNGKVTFTGGIEEVVSVYENNLNSNTIVNPDIFPLKAKGFAIQMNSLSSRIENTSDGADLYIEFELESGENFSILGVNFLIQTTDGQIISKILFKMADLYIKDFNTGKKTFTLVSKNINHFLAAGEYMYSVYINIPRAAKLIYAHQLGRFEIPGYDSYGFGTFFESAKHGIVPIPLKLEEA